MKHAAQPDLAMNPLDWLLAIFLLYSAVRAALRGFLREAFALGGLLLGFVLACWYYPPVAHALLGLISSPPLAQCVAFLLILSVATVVASLLGSILHRTATAIGLGFLNRAGGALFGLLRGAVLGGAFLLALTAFLPTAPWMVHSTLAPYLLRAAHAVSFVMPSELAGRFADGLSRLKHTAPGWIKSTLPAHTELNATQNKERRE